MRQVLNNELKRAFINYKMLLVIIFEVVLIVLYTIQQVFPICFKINPFFYSVINTGKVDGIYGAYYAWIGFYYTEHRTILFTIIPLLAALPYGASLYLDERGKYTENILLRCRRRDYYISKLAAMFLSGGFVAAFPFILSMLINMTLLPFEKVHVALLWFEVRDKCVLSELFYRTPFIYCMIFIVWTFFGFGLLNCMCYIASYIFENKFMVMVFPFVIYYASFVICTIFEVNEASPWTYLKFCNMSRDWLISIVLQIVIATGAILTTVWLRGRSKSDII